MSEFDNTAIPANAMTTAGRLLGDPADPGPLPCIEENRADAFRPADTGGPLPGIARNRPLTGGVGVDRTVGELRVCLDFNPGADDWVGNIKRRAAELIDYIDAIPQPGIDAARWKAEAMTCVETGAMYAVKAATAGQQDYGEGSGYRSLFPVGETTGGTP